MTAFRNSTLTYLAGILFLGALFAVQPVVAHAQTNADSQEIIDSVKSAIDMSASQHVLTAADVNGLSPCTDTTVGSCGQVAAAESKFGLVTYNKGDVLKCSGVVTISCAVSNSSGTKFQSTRFTSSTVVTDAQGKITGAKDLGVAAVTDAFVGQVADQAAGALTGGTGQCLASVTDIFSISSWGDCFIKTVGSAILLVANFLLGMAGTLLNWVVVKAVFQFGSLIGNSPGVLIAWGIFRDIGNLILLFGFIFMGLAMILNLNTFSAKKAIPRLLLFAILMNFSLFAAEAIIDSTNALTSVMYSLSDDDRCASIISNGTVTATGNTAAAQNSTSGTNALNDCATNYGLAGHIMQSTGLATIWKTSAAGFSATTVTYIGLALFATVGAVVLFAAAIMLVIRLIVLSFLMVTSPIGFAGMAIPPMQGFAKMWWKKLISESIFAPILFLLILVSLKITDSFSETYGERGLAGALQQPNASVMGIVMVFVIVIGFLVASLIAAKKVGASGATFAVQKGGAFAFGSMGFVGRRTVGAGSSWTSKRIKNSDFGKTETGRRVATFVGKGASSSFDLRATKAAGVLKKATKLDFGMPGKEAAKGISEIEKKAAEKKTAYSKTFDMTDDERTNDAKLKNSKKIIEDGWKEQEKKLDSEQAKLEAKVRENDASTTMQDLQLKIAAKNQESAAALARGDTPAIARIADERKLLENQLAQHVEQTKRDTEALGAVKDRLESEQKAYSNEVKVIQTQIEQNNPQGRYAANLEKKGWGAVFIGARVNTKAAKDIRAELKKSKTDKDTEKIIKALEKGGDDADAAKKKLKEGEGEKKDGSDVSAK